MSRQDDGVKTNKSDCNSVAQNAISNSKNDKGGGTVSTRFRVDCVIIYAPVCLLVRRLH